MSLYALLTVLPVPCIVTPLELVTVLTEPIILFATPENIFLSLFVLVLYAPKEVDTAPCTITDFPKAV